MASAKYPTVVAVYGGPHVQLIRDEWNMMENMRWQVLTGLGYVVAVCDGSGSWNRGLAFEGRLKHKMGQVEVQDQVLLVKELVARGITDPSRVAVTGWSYGGYLSLMCLAQAPEVFKIAIAGAPVTLWEGYDTGYTVSTSLHLLCSLPVPRCFLHRSCRSHPSCGCPLLRLHTDLVLHFLHVFEPVFSTLSLSPSRPSFRLSRLS